MQVLERQPWSADFLDCPCGSRSHVTHSFRAFFPIKIDPRSQKIGDEIPFMHEAARFPQEKEGTGKQCYPCRKPLLSLRKNGLQPEGAAETKQHSHAILSGGKEVEDAEITVQTNLGTGQHGRTPTCFWQERATGTLNKLGALLLCRFEEPPYAQGTGRSEPPTLWATQRSCARSPLRKGTVASLRAFWYILSGPPPLFPNC